MKKRKEKTLINKQILQILTQLQSPQNCTCEGSETFFMEWDQELRLKLQQNGFEI